MRKIILAIGLLFAALQVEAAPIKGDLKKELLPQPVYSQNSDYVDLYWRAWELAWDRVRYQDGIFQSPYMDENLWDDTIWIWDTEFMVLFCRYAPTVFPGIESLDNFYESILNKKSSALRIQHPDNPPFYAWVEYEYYKMTGDKERIKKVLGEDKFPQRHYQWFDSLKRGTKLHFDHAPIRLEKTESGYLWGWVASGMDNTPRGRDREGEMLWVDALAQQALSALYIQRLADEIGDKKTAKAYKALYKHNKELLNSCYWDEQDGFYYDIQENDRKFLKVRTPSVYWTMLAEVPDKKQAERLVQYAENPAEFGGKYPWPSVSRSDRDYNQIGDYWRGGVWLPHAYMATKALERYGYDELAYEHSKNLLENMFQTYSQFTPHTIWECYSPSAPRPAERQYKDRRELVTKDFCGWSALGPISLFIENVLGFHNIDATKKLVEWNKRGTGTQGLKNLKFGNIVTDIIADQSTLNVTSNNPYTLSVNGKRYKINAGEQSLKL